MKTKYRQLLTNLIVATIFLLIGLLLVQRFLPRDKQDSQTLRFQIGADFDKVANNWMVFAQDQKALLLKKTIEIHPRLIDYLTIEINSLAPEITLTARYASDSDIGDSFPKLIRDYIYYRSETEAQPQSADRAEPEIISDDMLYRSDLERLEHYKKIYDEREQKLTKLQTDRNLLEVAAVKLERQLARKSSLGLKKYIAAQLEQSLAEDAVLQHSAQLAELLQKQLAQFDLEAGQTNSRKELDEIDRRRDEINHQSWQLKQRIKKRRQLLTEQISQKNWPSYKAQLQEQIARKHHFMASNSAQQNAIIQALKRIEGTIASMQDQLRRSRAHELKTKGSFQPRLLSDLNDFSTTYHLSNLQCIVVAVFGIVGLATSLLIRVSTTSAKTTTTIAKKQKSIRPPQKTLSSTVPQIPPLATIDLTRQTPPPPEDEEGITKPAWSPQYDRLADTVNTLRSRLDCPRVIISALEAKDASVRFAVNLGIALTRKSLRVLLIETEQTSNDLAEIFRLHDDAGFFDWRRGDIWISQAAHQSQLENLSFMPSGSASAQQTSSQLDLSKEEHRWKNLSTKFDVVLLYSPSALAEPRETPQQIASADLLDIADAVFSLTRSKHATPQITTRLNDILSDHKADLLEIISIKK